MRKAVLLAAALLLSLGALAQPLDFSRTLRADYIFSGNGTKSEISLARLKKMDSWAGRRVNLDTLLLAGNGRVEMRDTLGKLLYANSFSTLFQEWQATEEATRVTRAFENVFLFPMPACPVDITVSLSDSWGRPSASLTHRVDPSDILIYKTGDNPPAHRYIHRGGSPEECIDIAMVAEGYSAGEMDKFISDCNAAAGSLFAHEPFASYRDRFNIVAVELPSRESGVSVPGQGIWKDTPVHSHFNTFYSDRYLTTLYLFQLHDALAGIPYEHIVILANTDTYGGGGIYNSYTLTTTGHPLFRQVVVHEFGHSFAGLADEYYYDDQFEEQYHPGVEPWEPNITTLTDFGSKWKDMTVTGEAGLVEGGGYVSKGVFRGSEDCRMKTNTAGSFCPVCIRAIIRMIDYQTRQSELE